MFIIDFDDTLFDTHSFKQTRLEAVGTFGVSEDVYWETYQEARNSSDGLFTYSNERHAEMIARRGFDKNALLPALETTTEENTLQTFLFPTTLDFLRALKAYGEPMILLSLGDPAFQELKLRGVGIRVFFDRVFMVDTRKGDVLWDVFTKEKERDAWFINDKVSETEELGRLFPKMRVVLRRALRFSLEEYENSGFPFFETLEEILGYIQQSKQSYF